MGHTAFRRAPFNRMIQAYNETGNLPPLPEVSSLEDFREKYPASGKNDLRRTSKRFIAEGRLKGSYIISTSGTTSEPLVLGHKLWEDTSEGTYPHQFVVQLMTHVFAEDDVVINLFTPGGLGFLYEGACRFLEPIGVTILPVGLLDSLSGNPDVLTLFRDLGLNTVMGAPSSVVQFAKEAERRQIPLDIQKIVYTGEEFFPGKKEIVSRIWPNASYYSLFGAVEYGFAAINSPEMPEGLHEILEDWYFVETDEDDNILVTDLTAPLLPVIRYRIGDKGAVREMPGTEDRHGLILEGRSDSSFNITGNAVSHKRVCDAVGAVTKITDSLQIILETDDDGRDLLTVAFAGPVHDDPTLMERVRAAVATIPEIAEGIDRGTLITAVAGGESQKKNWRNKTGNIIDLRGRQPAADGEAD